jgi:hypothetical protein
MESQSQQGMAARAEILGDTGANHPDNWLGGLASPDLHAIVILFARDVAERERCVRKHEKFASQSPDLTGENASTAGERGITAPVTSGTGSHR